MDRTHAASPNTIPCTDAVLNPFPTAPFFLQHHVYPLVTEFQSLFKLSIPIRLYARPFASCLDNLLYIRGSSKGQ